MKTRTIAAIASLVVIMSACSYGTTCPTYTKKDMKNKPSAQTTKVAHS